MDEYFIKVILMTTKLLSTIFSLKVLYHIYNSMVERLEVTEKGYLRPRLLA